MSGTERLEKWLDDSGYFEPGRYAMVFRNEDRSSLHPVITYRVELHIECLDDDSEDGFDEEEIVDGTGPTIDAAINAALDKAGAL